MFLDYLYNLPNSTSGLDQIVVDTVTAEPSFTPLILFFVWGVVFGGGISRQLMKSGTADYPMWAVMASLSAFMTALIMSVTTGIIRLDWLVIVVVITIFSFVWLAFDKRGNDV